MQLKEILFIVSIIISVNAVNADLSKEEQEYLESVFRDVPLDQRKYVLLHQLYLGYIEENPHVTPRDYDIPPGQTKKIYDLFNQKMRVPDNKPKVKGQICFPNGSCIDTDDSGIYPR